MKIIAIPVVLELDVCDKNGREKQVVEIKAHGSTVE